MKEFIKSITNVFYKNSSAISTEFDRLIVEKGFNVFIYFNF